MADDRRSTQPGSVVDQQTYTPVLERELAGRAGARPAGPAPRRRSRADDWRRRLEVALLVTPALALFVLFVVVPVVRAGYYSVYNWNGLGELEQFVGMANYREAVGDDTFRDAIRHNVIIVVLSILIQLPIGLGIALLLNRDIPFRGLFRTLIFVPYVLAEVVAGVIWLLMLQPTGFVNAGLEAVGFGDGFTRAWLGDPDIALYTLFLVLTWKYVGFAIILFLAGLQGVPADLHEAAALDGASWWKIQRHITIPLLGPTIRIWIFLSMIGSLQLFDLVWVMTEGGPANSTSTMVTYLIAQGFERFRFGYGSAVAVILFAISFAVALIYQRFVLRRDIAEPVSGRRR